jgi:hypothetical protein
MNSICYRCGETGATSKDHIVPKWLTKRATFFGVSKPEGEGQSWERICVKCNAKKGGIIDYSHPFVRYYMRNLILQIQRDIEKHEKN